MGTGVDFFGAGSTAAVAQVWFALYWLISELWNAETHLHLYLKYFICHEKHGLNSGFFLPWGGLGWRKIWLHLPAVMGAPAAPGFQVYLLLTVSKMHILLPKPTNLCIFYMIDREIDICPIGPQRKLSLKFLWLLERSTVRQAHLETPGLGAAPLLLPRCSRSSPSPRGAFWAALPRLRSKQRSKAPVLGCPFLWNE